MKKYRHSGLVLISYFLLTVLMTWPTILHLANGIPGDGFDGWQNYWNLWWVKQALLNLGTNPFFTDFLYPPTGVSLLFHTLNIFNSFWTLPIQLNFGLTIAYNSIVLLSFTLAGYGGYLLALSMLARLKLPARMGQGLRPAAFVGGLVFTMSPFHMAHLLGHMQVFSMIWPPFYIIWLLRTLEPWRVTKPTGINRHQWRNAALTSLFLILATLVDWYHTLYLLIFTGLVLLWTITSRGLAWRKYGRVGKKDSTDSLPGHRSLLQPIWLILAIGLGFAIAMAPVLIPMIRNASSRPDLQTGLVQNVTLSADLLAFILPSEMHPLWGDWAKRIAANFSTTTSERLIFAGFVPLALGIFAAIRGWSSPIVKFWIMAATVFLILSVGPFLHVNGEIATIGGWHIPMPYFLLYYTVPFIGLTRSLSRYDLMVMLSLSVLVPIGLVKFQMLLCQKWDTTHAPRASFRAPYLLPAIAAGLICFEFLPIPYPVSKIDTPAFYFNIGREPGDYTIAELPMNWDRPTPLLHQTTHGKRLLTAYTSRQNPSELAWRTPVLQHWRYLGPDIIDQPLETIAPTIFHDFNLRYIVLDYWQMPPGPEREATERWVAAALPDASPIYADGRLKVFQSPPPTITRPYLTLGAGWSDRQEDASGLVTRSFIAAETSQPELLLHHPDGQEQSLSLEITATSDSPQKLTVLANNQPLGQFEVTKTQNSLSVTLPLLSDNLVTLKLLSDNPASPVWVSRIGLEN